VEVHPEFTLSFVEFDDQGRFWNREQIDLLERTLDEENRRSDTDGVSIIFFAHGWRHDANVCDLNVACFRTFLQQVYGNAVAVARVSEGRIRPKRTVAIYVSWRGLSTKLPPLTGLSFWARKKVAHRIASGDLMELLTRVELFVRRANRTDPDRARLAVVGHSFGGTMVFAALANLLEMRVLEAMESRDGSDPQGGLIPGFGSLVVLLNPAFEALAFAPLHEAAERFGRFSPRQLPVLVIVASETDGPNAMWFRLGREVDTLFQSTGQHSPRREIVTAVGNYQPFWTHRLTAKEPAQVHPAKDVFGAHSGPCACKLPVSGVGDGEARELVALFDGRTGRTAASPGEPVPYGRATLTPVKKLDPRNPFWVVRASDEVIHGHSGIFTDPLLDFVRGLIVSASAERRVPPAQ